MSIERQAVISNLKSGDRIWIVSFNGHNTVIGTVERTTATVVFVVVDYSFQGGTNCSVTKYRRINNKNGYGAGSKIGGGMCNDYLGDIPTAVELNVYNRACQEKTRARRQNEMQAAKQEDTRNRLNALLPEKVYVEVNRNLDEFTVTIHGLVSEEEVLEVAKRLKHYRPAKG